MEEQKLARYLRARRPRKRDQIPGRLADLRHMVAFTEEDVLSTRISGAGARGDAWSILLATRPYPTSDYMALVRKGPAKTYSKIRHDSFRTLATDKMFQGLVSEAAVIRLLNAFVWRAEEEDIDLPYVQGLNVIAAPFLYCCESETKAFALFYQFVKYECPTYVTQSLTGVHNGLKLLDAVIRHLDKDLYDYLDSKKLSAQIYAFPAVITFNACRPPLEHVLKLWDFLLAYGVHHNIICCAAQIILQREPLLSTANPMKLLTNLTPVDANILISVSVRLIRKIPDNLYDLICRHTHDSILADEIDALF